MKTVIMGLIVAMSINAQAAKKSNEAKLCAKLEKLSTESCEESFDQECIEDHGNTCERDGDYYEGFGICVSEEVDQRLAKYNYTNGTNYTCEDY